MRSTVRRIAEPAVLVLVLGLVLVGCGAQRGGSLLPKAHPDRVLITVHGLAPFAKPATATVDDAAAAAKLYAAMGALPSPAPGPCTADKGISYDLAFFESGQAVVTADADSGGCQTVTISTTDVRHADAAFWTLLEQTIAEHAPPVQTTRLEAVRRALPDQVPATFVITAAAPAQALYEAIGSLPSRPTSSVCELSGTYDELVFLAGDQRIPATADHNGCVTIWVPALGHNVMYQADDVFWQLMDRTLTDTWAAPARPDRLLLWVISKASGDPAASAIGESGETITQPALTQPLFDALFALSVPPPGWQCTAPPGTVYGLDFSWDEMGMVGVHADRGCGTVSFATIDGAQVHLADQHFWDAFLRAAT